MMVEPLYIPPSKKGITGLTVYCNKCKKTVTDQCKEPGKKLKSLKKCRFGQDHRFKVVLYRPEQKNVRITKILESRNIYDAIQEASGIEKKVKDNLFVTEENKRGDLDEVKPKLFIHGIARYISYLKNEGVISFKQKERSPEYIKDVERGLAIILNILEENGYIPDSFKIDDFSDKIIGQIYDSILEKGYSGRTQNKYFGYATSFLKWWNEEQYPIRNWFKQIPREPTNPDPQGISKEEYDKLLLIIDREKGIVVDKRHKKGRKTLNRRYRFRKWLKDAIKLGLETGRRREEIISMKWSDITADDTEGPIYIKVEDFKVNRIKHNKQERNKKYNYVPVTKSLNKLLFDLGYVEKKNSNEYILAPTIQLNRVKSMSENLSRGFSHYYNQLGTEKKLTFKSLRKTYITNLSIHTSDPKIVTGHSSDAVVNDYYIVKTMKAFALRDFKVFPNTTNDRNEELSKARNKSNDRNKQIEK